MDITALILMKTKRDNDFEVHDAQHRNLCIPYIKLLEIDSVRSKFKSLHESLV